MSAFPPSAFPPLGTGNMMAMSAPYHQQNNHSYLPHIPLPGAAASSATAQPRRYNRLDTCVDFQETGPSHNSPPGRCSFCTNKERVGVFQRCSLCGMSDHGLASCQHRAYLSNQALVVEFQQHAAEVKANKAFAKQNRATFSRNQGPREQRGGAQSSYASAAAGGPPIGGGGPLGLFPSK
jgi:hypothetical protein